MKQVFSDDNSIHLKFIECGMKFWQRSNRALFMMGLKRA